MRDLDFTVISGNHCWDSIQLLMLKSRHCEPYLYWLNKFFVSYFDKEEISLEEKITYQLPYKDFIILKRFYGLNLEIIPVSSSPPSSQLKKLLPKSPVGIWLDAFDCSWAPMHKRKHFPHYCLVLECDLNERRYVCADVHFPHIGKVYLDFSTIDNSVKQIISYHFSAPPKLEESDYYSLLLGILDGIEEQKMEKERQAFLRYITQEEVIEKERIPLEEMNISILFLKFLWISEYKINLKKSFQYLIEQFGLVEMDSIEENLQKSAEKFLQLKNLIIKGMLINTGMQKEIQEEMIVLINEIYTLDLEIVSKLKTGMISWENRKNLTDKRKEMNRV